MSKRDFFSSEISVTFPVPNELLQNKFLISMYIVSQIHNLYYKFNFFSFS